MLRLIGLVVVVIIILSVLNYLNTSEGLSICCGRCFSYGS